MMTHLFAIAGNLPIKTLVARQWPTKNNTHFLILLVSLYFICRCVCVCVCVCVCACVCERERKRESVCERERERVCVCVCERE